jgi:molecular chaperone DnaK (HSP70)
MKLGIDFGTTRIVAAAADRGNYPLVGFDAPDVESGDGQPREWFPPLVAVRGGELRFGWSAWAVQGDRGWTVLRSLKRLLKDASPVTSIELGGRTMPLMDVVTGLLSAFRRQLREGSTHSIDSRRADRGDDRRTGQCQQQSAISDGGSVSRGGLSGARNAERAFGGER